MSKSSKGSKRSRVSAPELQSFVARVKIINDPDSDQQPILYHIISAADVKEARHLAEEYFLDQHKELE